MRADARRNRDQILAAARELVARSGEEATMDAIAELAGVAVGTLYRHFPVKDDLVQAVVDDSVERMAVRTERALEAVRAGADAGTQLAAAFADVAHQHSTDLALKAAAGRLDVDAELAAASPGSPVARAAASIGELIELAKRAGAVRPDLTVVDLPILLNGVPDGSDARVQRYLDIVVAGLAP